MVISDQSIGQRGVRPTLFQYLTTLSQSQSIVTQSEPGQILSGGAMHLTGGDLVNDKSRIIAGGALTGDLHNLHNREAEGVRITHETGTSQYTYSRWRGGFKRYHEREWHAALPYTPADIVNTITLAVTEQRQNTAPDTVGAGSGLQLAQVGASQTVGAGNLPDNSLFSTNPNPAANYLIETDPRFANYRNWLGSDYLLNALSSDPASTQKRLGDGFYEQRLIREQVAQLTGRRFLDGHQNDEAQFLALMDSGLTVAREFNLRPGIALTAAQMAQLTSDIVWLVEQTVTLADGSTQQVLAPQVYLRVREGDLQASGALIAGDSVHLNLTGDLTNSGSIAGRTLVSLTAENVRNLGGRIGATDLALHARSDLANRGGQISATDRLIATAGRDMNLISTTHTDSKTAGRSSFSRTGIDRVAGLYVTGDNALLIASAGRDANLTAAQITHSGQNGQTLLAAGRDLKLATLATAEQNNSVSNSTNYLKQGSTRDIGTQIQTQGALHLQAGNDLNASAATITSAQGAINVQAGNNITLSAGQSSANFAEARQHKSKGFLSSKTTTTRDTQDETRALGTTFSGDSVTLIADRDLQVKGSHVVASNATTLQAGRNLSIEAATHTATETHFRQEKKSGVFSSGGIGITIGSRMNSTDQQSEATTAAKSTIGSLAGDVTLLAGETYKQVGSDVIAAGQSPSGSGGDIHIAAKTVDIVEARETSRTTIEQKSKQSGLTLAITSPVITAVQTAQQMASAAKDTSDPRMKALAAASTGLAGYNAHAALEAGQGKTVTLADGTVKDNQIPVLNEKGEVSGYRDATAADKLGGIGINLSIGGSKSQSNTTQSSDTAAVSNLTAGRDIRIEAGGAGPDSDIRLQGTHAQAARNLSLIAEDEVRLLAAKNTYEQHSTNQNSSASVGIGFMVGGTQTGFTIQAGVSTGRGSADGSDQTHTLTKVGAGGTAHLASGGDTILQGATVAAQRIVADVGGDLLIESLQDTSSYASRQKSAGVSVSLCIPPFCVGAAPVSGSVSASNSKVNSDYASVTDQSGIRAGDQGFDVKVKGDTDLKGGAITSTQQAIDDNLNRFETDGQLTLSDIQNKAEYKAKSASVNIGTSLSFDGALKPGGTSAGFGKDGDKAESMTLAAISGVAGNQNARTGDAETGIKPIFDADKVQKEIDAQVKITQTFNEHAPKAAVTHASDMVASLNKQAEAESDPVKRAELREEAKKWGPNGSYMVAMNIIIGAAGGNLESAVTKETLSWAANEMRQAMIKDSKKFKGFCDAQGNCISNQSGQSAGVNGDEFKLAGGRIVLSDWCADGRCTRAPDDAPTKSGYVENADETVIFTPKDMDGNTISLVQFIEQHDDWRSPLGGHQGGSGQMSLLGIQFNYVKGSFWDKLAEAYAGTHDMLNSIIWYDELGNTKNLKGLIERIGTTANMANVGLATPFALSVLLPPEVWNSIYMLNKIR